LPNAAQTSQNVSPNSHRSTVSSAVEKGRTATPSRRSATARLAMK